MARTLTRTYRHLDRPTRFLGLSPGQWLLVVAGLAALWACLRLGFLPGSWRLSLGVFLGGLPVGLSLTGRGEDRLLEWPRRAWHHLAAPREYVAGPPRRGPLALALVATRPIEEDPPEA